MLRAALVYGLLAVSYRGYGGSTGSPTQAGLIRDGEAAYREALARGYNADRIILMGASLGTGVAIALAAARSAAEGKRAHRSVMVSVHSRGVSRRLPGGIDHPTRESHSVFN